MKLVLKWVISALSLMVVDAILSGMTIASFYTALIASFVLGILNAVARPILIILTLPINILTLGLFTLIINGGLIFFVGTFVRGFDIDFRSAVLASLLLWVISWITNVLIRD